MQSFICPRCGQAITVTAAELAEADRQAEMRYARRLGKRRWRSKTEYVCQGCAVAQGEQGAFALDGAAS